MRFEMPRKSGDPTLDGYREFIAFDNLPPLVQCAAGAVQSLYREASVTGDADVQLCATISFCTPGPDGKRILIMIPFTAVGLKDLAEQALIALAAVGCQDLVFMTEGWIVKTQFFTQYATWKSLPGNDGRPMGEAPAHMRNELAIIMLFEEDSDRMYQSEIVRDERGCPGLSGWFQVETKRLSKSEGRFANIFKKARREQVSDTSWEDIVAEITQQN